MSYAVGPVAVPAAGRVQLPVPSESPNALGAVVIDNATPYIVTVALGGDARFLAPFTSDLFLLPPSISQAISLTAARAPGGPATTTQSYVTATYYDTTEDPPDGYPVALAAQLIQAVLAGGFVDTVGTVTNPVTPDPAGTIAVVSSSVPFPNRDTFFWPAISGEAFPPTKNGNSQYSFSAEHGTGMILATQAGGSPGQVTYPNLPRIGYNGKQTMMWEWYGWVQGTIFPVASSVEIHSAVIGYNLNNWRTGYVYKSNAAGTALDLYGRLGATSGDFLIAAGEPQLNLRHFQVFLDANGTAEWWVDGARVGQLAGDWPALYVGQAIPTLQMTSVGNATGSLAATRITAQWT